MKLRKYKTFDCKELTELFYHTVHNINAKDYNNEQLNAWAPRIINLKKWDKSFLEHITIVAVENNEIIGFGDIDSSGYLNRLYVHANHQRKGIANAICNKLEQLVKDHDIFTHTSITAKPFFENRRYKVIYKQKVIKNGISLTNFIMKKIKTN